MMHDGGMGLEVKRPIEEARYGLRVSSHSRDDGCLQSNSLSQGVHGRETKKNSVCALVCNPLKGTAILNRVLTTIVRESLLLG